ncbi:MAG: hypothetical protein O2865_00560 [Planctomycetota bacterium]|nr:hypothetical protein [Planctomycetota bacterium]
MSLAKVLPITVALAAVVPLTGQSRAEVIPNGFANHDGATLSDFPFGAYDTRRQLIVAGSELGPSRNRDLVGMQFRRNAGGDTSPLDGGRVRLRVTLSSSPLTASQACESFAANRGSDATVVFDGVIDLPATPAPTSDPAPWVEPFAVTIPFQTAFRLASSALCIETETSPYTDPLTGTTDEPWWPVDATIERTPDDVTNLGASCWTENPSPMPACVVPDTFTLGGRGVFTLTGPTQPRPAVCMVGLSGSEFLGLTLPFDLGFFGAPGCSLQIAPFLQIPAPLARTPAGPRTEAHAELPIPNDANLTSLPLFAQWMVFVPGNNLLGTHWSNGVSIRIDPTNRDIRYTWIEAPDLVSGIGHVFRGRSPVIRILDN